ncbi:MAG: hypothetical protein V1770_03415 [bacterium]
MAKKWIGRGEEKIFFLVAMEDVLGYLTQYIMPAFVNAGDCLVICSSLEALLDEMVYWNLYCKQYETIQFRFYVDERISGIVPWATSFRMNKPDAVFKPVHPFLEKMEKSVAREKLT